jgi:RHS repeat-associated protein
MRAGTALLALTALLAPALTAASDPTDPALERGFTSDGMFQSLDIDHVDLFRGGLELTIPLGQSYHVGGALSYGFALAYHSDVWDVITQAQSPTLPETSYDYTAFPSALSNAGLGWRVSLGELIDPDALEQFHPAWTYVAPDGSEHQFFATLHPGEAEDDDDDQEIKYTRSGTYMRMRLWPHACTIEMADGTVHTFEEHSQPQHLWRLTRIDDRFGNWLQLAYDTEPDGLLRIRWTMTDSQGRTHYAYFDPAHKHLVEVNLAAFDDPDVPGEQRAVYAFNYQWPLLHRHCLDNVDSTSDYLNAGNPPTPGGPDTIPILDSVTLPDGTYYRMHDGAVPSPAVTYTLTCTWDDYRAGTIKRLFLPSGGGLEWDYASLDYQWGEPIAIPGGYDSQGHGVFWPAVAARRMLDPAGDPLAGHAWLYRREVNTAYFSGHEVDPFGNCPWDCGIRYLESRMVVTAPDGNETVYYARAYPGTFGGVERGEYGLGFTRRVADPLVGGERFLSVQYFQGAVSFDPVGNPLQTPLRTIYRSWDLDDDPGAGHRHVNRHLASERVVFEGDTGCSVYPGLSDTKCFTLLTNTQFDGLGHFRTSATNGNFPSGNVRTTWTNFNPTLGDYPPARTGSSWFPEGAPWVINTFTDASVGEPGSFTKSESCFDEMTGFLRARRTIVGVEAGEGDVLWVATPDTHGNVATEEWRGGDLGTIPDVALYCPSGSYTPVGGAAYRVDSTYEYGSLATSHVSTPEGTSVGFLSVDRDIDPSTGLPALIRDTAGLATDLTYDALGRVVSRRPRTTPLAGGAWIDIAYQPATGTSPASAHVTHRQNGATSGSLAERTYRLDWFGRLTAELALLPATSCQSPPCWNQRLTSYDGMGRKDSVSELQPEGTSGTAVRKTTFSEFDPFGRPGRIRPPDGAAHDVTLAYTGVRRTTRSVKVATSRDAGGNVLESTAETIEERDRQGRLWKLREWSGRDAQGNPALVETQYGYDAGGHLTSAITASNGTTQTRTFSYDNRGFLTSEDLPEKDIPSGRSHDVTYLDFDARGHAHRVVDGPSDLTFTFDRAERLTEVREATGSQRLLKLFEYDTLGGAPRGYSAGKLVRSTANNYFNPFPTINFQVRQTLTYSGRDGRVSSRTTETGDTRSSLTPYTQGFTWTDLGAVETLSYPSVTTAPGVPSRTVTNTYAAGALIKVSEGTTDYASPITYHANGLVNTVNHGNQVWDVFGKDPNDIARPQSITATRNGTTTLWQTGAYAYDGAGNVKAMGGDTTIYDPVSRLTSGRMPLAGRQQCATYDAFGNITAIADAPTGSACTPSAITILPAQNRLGSATYDAAGNMTSWGSSPDQYAYFYYPSNELRQVTNPDGRWTVHAYDAAGERTVVYDDVEKTLRTTLRGLDGSVLRELVETVGEGTHTVGIFRTSDRQWYLRNSNSAGNADLVFPYGDPATDVPVVGDWDGDASDVDTIGIYRSNVFYLRNTNTPGNADVTVGFGALGDIPVVGDWDGDGDDTVGVYRPSTGWWYLRNSNTPGNPDLAFTFGPANQTPVTGDWDGNGTDTIGIYSGNVFYLRNTNTSGNADLTAAFGAAGDRPVTGDWDGDGDDTIGVYRPGTGAWFLRNTNSGGAADLSFSYGLANETPVVGDWDGMGGVLSWAKDYVVRDGLPLASIEPVGGTPVTTHFHLDHLGSVRRLTNASGTVVASRDYLPFGSFITNTTSERLAFTAHARDLRSTGNQDDLDYMHARYYNPTLGRFLSPDPVRGSPRRPQSFNLYGYVRSNPVNFVDPWGLLPLSAGFRGEITVTDDRCQSVPAGFTCNEWRAFVDGMQDFLIRSQQSMASLLAAGREAGDRYTDFHMGFYDTTTLGLGKLFHEEPDDEEAHAAGAEVGELYLESIAIVALERGLLGLSGKTSWFGRGGKNSGGLLNSNDLARIGWSWEGSAGTGRRVFRIGIGSKRTRFHGHVRLWPPPWVRIR